MTKFKEALETLNAVSGRGVEGEGEYFNCAFLEFTTCPSDLIDSVNLIYATVDESNRNSYVAALFSQEHAHELKSDLDELMDALIISSEAGQAPTPENKEILLHRWNTSAIQFNNKWEWLGKMKPNISDFLEAWNPRRSYITPKVPGDRKDAIRFILNCVWNLDDDDLRKGLNPQRHLKCRSVSFTDYGQDSRFSRDIFAMKGMGDVVAARDASLSQANEMWKEALAAESKLFHPRDAEKSPLLKAMLEAFPRANMDDIAAMLTKVKGGATPLEAIESTQWSEEDFVEKLTEIMETSPWKN